MGEKQQTNKQELLVKMTCIQTNRQTDKNKLIYGVKLTLIYKLPTKWQILKE